MNSALRAATACSFVLPLVADALPAKPMDRIEARRVFDAAAAGA